MKQLFIHLLSAIFLLPLSATSSATNDFIILDRGHYKNIFRVTSDLQISTVSAGVPWERASSIAVDSAGNFIVTVDIYSAYENQNGVYKVTSTGDIFPVATGDPFYKPSAITIDEGNYIITQPPAHLKLTFRTQDCSRSLIFRGK
jgi:predicted RND superfamily exporter protein